VSVGEPLDPPPPPAEARLGQVLQILRDDAPQPTHALAVRVVERARWQGALRSALRVVSQFAGAASGVARLLIGRRA